MEAFDRHIPFNPKEVTIARMEKIIPEDPPKTSTKGPYVRQFTISHMSDSQFLIFHGLH